MTLINAIPGLFILCFSMAALFITIQVAQKNQALTSYYAENNDNLRLLKAQYIDFETAIMRYMTHANTEHYEALKTSFTDFAAYYEDYSISQSSLVQTGRDFGGKDSLFAFQSDLLDTATAIRVLGQYNGPYFALDGVDSSSQHRDQLFALRMDIEQLWEELHGDDHVHGLVNDISQSGQQLYWIVLIIGLTGFLLVVLNTDKLLKLSHAQKHNDDVNQLLQARLAAMEASRDGIGIVDADGTLSYMNKALMILHGISPNDKDSFLGQDWRYLYNDAGRNELNENFLMDLQTTGYWRGQRKIKRHDGKVIMAELSLTVLPSGGLIGTAREVTDATQASAERDDLQEQLFQAQKMEAVGRLAGGIAHDFNNILAAMNGYAEFLIEDLKDHPDQKEFASKILQAGKQAKDLVDQMLAFSRANKSSEMEAIDLTKPFLDTETMLRASFPKSIDLSIHKEKSGVFVEANASQMGQMIMNLAVNAGDAMEDNSGEVFLSLETINSQERLDFPQFQDDFPDQVLAPPIKLLTPSSKNTVMYLNVLKKNTEYALLTVRDTGTGISKTVLEHIFEPFFTTKDVNKGTGLGLSTVHGVVVSHKGAMIIDTTLGQGTKFEILLPLCHARGEDQADGIDEDEEAQEVSGCILLVEDQKTVADMTLKMLERMGFDAHLAHNGQEAMKVLQENSGAFDVVLTDHNMPKMTGFDLIKRIHMESPEQKFIVLSGYKEEELDPLIFEHEAVCDVLRKPISRQDLEKSLLKAIKRK